MTGSPALLAEAFHSLADSGNEVLLRIAQVRGDRPADAAIMLTRRNRDSLVGEQAPEEIRAGVQRTIAGSPASWP